MFDVRVKKIQKGTLWELYCSQEESLSYREYCGTYEVDELRTYFEEVDFDLEEDFGALTFGLLLEEDIFGLLFLLIVDAL